MRVAGRGSELVEEGVSPASRTPRPVEA
jgi:hypothetical protein